MGRPFIRAIASLVVIVLVGVGCATTGSPPAEMTDFDARWAALKVKNDPASQRERFLLAMSVLTEPRWTAAVRKDDVVHQADSDASAAVRAAPGDLEVARANEAYQVRFGSRPGLARARCHLAGLERDCGP